MQPISHMNSTQQSTEQGSALSHGLSPCLGLPLLLPGRALVGSWDRWRSEEGDRRCWGGVCNGRGGLGKAGCKRAPGALVLSSESSLHTADGLVVCCRVHACHPETEESHLGSLASALNSMHAGPAAAQETSCLPDDVRCIALCAAHG